MHRKITLKHDQILKLHQQGGNKDIATVDVVLDDGTVLPQRTVYSGRYLELNQNEFIMPYEIKAVILKHTTVKIK